MLSEGLYSVTTFRFCESKILRVKQKLPHGFFACGILLGGFVQSKILRGSQKLPRGQFAARHLAGRFPAQGKIRHVKQIAFAICSSGNLDGDFAPHTLESAFAGKCSLVRSANSMAVGHERTSVPAYRGIV